MREFNCLTVEYYPDKQLMIWRIKNTGMPNFCLEGLREFKEFIAWVKEYFSHPLRPLKYIASASEHDGIYNLGGDLPFFLQQIRENNQENLTEYAHLCIDAIHAIYTSFGLPAMTIALVEGNAYGGGFECALAHDYILAMDKAKFGLPESKFNLFPGMGAYSLLMRKLGPVESEKVLTADALLSASELIDKGLITEEFSAEKGLETLFSFVRKNARNYNFNFYHQMCKKQVNDLKKAELINITNLWVKASQGVDHFDMRKMEAFGKAQSRKMQLASS